jgi:periplasmic divalent cation tolerance protein
MQSEYIQVMTAVDQKESAENLAQVLVSRRLAACVQVIGPITSTYWWEGQVEQAEEWLCLLKTRTALFASVEAAVREVHPYAVPEILAIPVVAGSASYLQWITAEVRET